MERRESVLHRPYGGRFSDPFSRWTLSAGMPSAHTTLHRHRVNIMADSDEEYIGEVSEDEDDFPVTRNDRVPTRKRKQRGGAEWELSRTWETLVEGADGTISSTVEGLLEAGKRKR